MSGRELLEVMDNYSNRLDQESLITTERLMYEHCIKDNLPAIIKNLKNVVGSFAFRAISLQVSQSEHYKCVLVKKIQISIIQNTMFRDLSRRQQMEMQQPLTIQHYH